ncbi:hypothetical protein H6G89_04180 [Oscillatoria sp. FACHB-1407]|uniref:hypothetical protein n=1 Tax=Oscillatoria sp. FACHB-1407 TaxID=2692847 RepID=UPI001689041F|nr:hypothetical protein [Oscillatoria sp. FACHB-1407]MBD2460235.1 hypothetical protein [Oscillatoria sp. FACHB-1407]
MVSPPSKDDPFKHFDKIFFWVGLGFLVVFNLIGGSFVLLATAKSLVCDRTNSTQPTCTVKAHQSPFDWERTLQIFPVSELLRAEVERPTSREDLYRVVIFTERGKLYLTDAYSSGYDDKAVLAVQINSFVQNPQETHLQIQQGDRWVFYLIGTPFIFVGTLIGFVFIYISCSAKSTLS